MRKERERLAEEEEAQQLRTMWRAQEMEAKENEAVAREDASKKRVENMQFNLMRRGRAVNSISIKQYFPCYRFRARLLTRHIRHINVFLFLFFLRLLKQR